MKPGLFLGIDPGLSGGIAILDDTGAIVHVQKMPETERDTADVLQEFGPRIDFALIEKVGAMPKQGVSSTWKFGQHYGFLRGLLIALRLTFDQVRPQEWQRETGCLSGGDKNVTKAKAQQLFPEQKITHATADALLLAEYARRMKKVNR
jgi:crossover junction endodeoxyribonuclease RuvC